MGEWADSPGSRAGLVRERVKAATSVSFSPDGRFLAVGETGYKPRVLIFSATRDAPPDTPLTSMSEHTFGVQCVTFSPDSQYLASLGTVNDGFLYIWRVNGRTGCASLYASNKCTSTVKQMAWMGTSVITVGTRHVKIWRVDDHESSTALRSADAIQGLGTPAHKALPGRNCLLGPLLESTFTSVTAVSFTKAVVCSDMGDVCLLDDSDAIPRFVKVAEAGFRVTAANLSNDFLHVAGHGGAWKMFSLAQLLAPRVSSPSPTPTSSGSSQSPPQAYREMYVVAMAPLNDLLVTLDSQHGIQVLKSPQSDDESSPQEVIQQLPAHKDAVLGVKSLSLPNYFKASFYTWSAGGIVLFWSLDGTCSGRVTIPMEQSTYDDDVANELKTVQAMSDENHVTVVSGDKYGVLRVLDGSTGQTDFVIKAHANEITDVAVHHNHDTTLIVSAGRDRTVQVFRQTADTWDLVQTLDEHVGAVTGLLFVKNATRLLSCSSDRTVVVREAVSRDVEGTHFTAFLIVRTITLKSTPIVMAPSQHDDILLVSTIDRHVHTYDMSSGRAIASFKVSDSEGGDAVVMSALLQMPSRGSSVLAGVSSTDKSIRLYSEDGCLLSRDWGHTEGVTDIALVLSDTEADGKPATRHLVTVAADGTIFIWDTSAKRSRSTELSRVTDALLDSTITEVAATNGPPLRKVLSQSELARLLRPTDGNVASPATPTETHSPRLRKKASRLSVAQTSKLDLSSMASRRRSIISPSPASVEPANRRATRHRTPSPTPSNSRNIKQSSAHRPAYDTHRAKSTGNVNGSSEFGSLGASTEQVCRTLRAYRKKLSTSSDSLTPEATRELERELGLAAKTIGEKMAKSKGIDEAVMARLLEQFSGKLAGMLDEKIEGIVKREVRRSGEGFGISAGEAKDVDAGASQT
ncbi:hypothetical protein LTR04_007212 [Oleoguttula sp. CCFEE 6159]|nr:hypothetical protein LTR04_007212 [Oleoguttula sp. CCFEE 6159]